MSRAISVTREGAARHGRYVGRVAGVEAEAELTFSPRGDDAVSADHTGAPDILRGTGVALAMVERLVADARADGFRIIPSCPYVRAQFDKHPDWAGVLADDEG